MKRAGLLLAGGASSRFGREKAVAPFGPGLLMDGPLHALTAACGEVAVSARPGSGAAEIAQSGGYPVLADAPGAPAGPLAGILAGLAWAAQAGCAVMATAPCDAATLRADQIGVLLEHAERTGGAAAGQAASGIEPLIAAWPVAAGLQAVRAAFAGGGHPPVRTLLAELGLVLVSGFDGVNVNAPADLMALGSGAANAEPAHARLFAFEDDFVRTLRCIPMCIRFKLDRTGVKLSLRQWSRFTLNDRTQLRLLPCEAPTEVLAYRDELERLIRERAGEAPVLLAEGPEPEWLCDTPPAQVVTLAQAQGLPPPDPQAWRQLDQLERYALVKLTRDKHENANLGPALLEFGAIT